MGAYIMGAILKKGAVFLHVPKTGGNWVIKVLGKKNIKRMLKEKHADYNRFFFMEKQHARKKPFIFCFVRDPLTWYESWWKYMGMDERNFKGWGYKPFHPCAPLDGCGDPDFNRFIEKCMKKRPGFVTELYSQFTKRANFIGKQETLLQDTLRLLRKLKIKHNDNRIMELGKINASEPRPLKWDPQLRKEMIKLEYAGIVRYGY